MDTFEILLLSVVVVTAWTGPMLFRRLPPGHRTFAVMILADLVLAILALAARSEGDGSVSKLLGVIAIGGAVCLLIVPPLLRDLTRRALAGDRLRLARFLVELRELLQPGMGGKQEGELIGTILAVRGGRVDSALEALERRRSDLADPVARRQVAERMVMTQLYARRWQDAVDGFESMLGGDHAPSSPQLMVEMVRAYCEIEDLESAAGLIERLERSPLAAEPMFAALVYRARMVFLAFVGRTGAVEAIVKGPLAAMPDAARFYWSGVARLNAGDRSGARLSLSQAAEASRRDSRARDLANELLGRLADSDGLGPRAVSPTVADLADRLTAAAAEAQPVSEPPRRDRPKGAQVTYVLVAANLLCALAMSLVFGGTAEIGGLVRSGANVKSAVLAGEWWRLASSMFIHVGALHLVLNMYGLWILGRLVEPMYGSIRFFAVYMTAGLSGALASVLLGGNATSAGASGAVFGLLGAAIAELALRRSAYPETWRKRLLANLLFLTAANVGIGFVVTMIDQAAHIGGLVGGGAVAVLTSPGAAAGARRWLGRALAVLGALACIYACVAVATTSYGDTLARYPRAQRTVGGIIVDVPEPWQKSDEHAGLQDSSLPLLFFIARLPNDMSAEDVVALRAEAEIQGNAKALGFDRIALADEPAFSLGTQWKSTELIATVDSDGLGGTQRYRAVVFASERGDELWFGLAYLPATLSESVGREIAKVLSSARPSSAEAVEGGGMSDSDALK